MIFTYTKKMTKAQIEIEKLVSGYIVHFTDETNWTTSKTVHETWESASAQLDAHVARIREDLHASPERQG